ncbi:MAG: sodium-dependent transporter [Clostridia bacterium]|nr:sodium-dependent transporter [Clostridia bacterium]
MGRDQFKSRLGFILVSAGCAIGIGNVWKFPFVTGQNGGGAFVVLYLFFLVILAAPILTMELAIGRASRRSSVDAYRSLERPGEKWHIHGYVSMLGCILLMSYYTTVSGWMLNYFVRFSTGAFHGVAGEEVSAVFGEMLSNPAEMVGYMALVVVLGFFVCSFSLQKGLERITKIMMTGLLALIVLLAVHSLLLPGAGEGVSFYLLPDLERAKEIGIFSVITSAMNQAFFTISIGVGAMEIFGSYMAKDKTLMTESVWICALDTFVALMSGLIIFPACFSYGVQTDAGPSLVFVTLPHVFLNMEHGEFFGACFFLFMTFASFSTVIAVFENIISFGVEECRLSRKYAAFTGCVMMLLLSLPSALGYNTWSHVHLIGGRDILDSVDYVVSNLLLPGGALVYLLFCSTKWGWGFDQYLEEANTGVGIRISPALKPFFRYILPLLILVILVQGLM